MNETRVAPTNLFMYRVYRIIMLHRRHTLHVVGQLVEWKREEGLLWFMFRLYDRKKPYNLAIKGGDLKEARIYYIDDYDPQCV